MIAAAQRLAAGLLLLVGIFCFYEGVPGISGLPFVGWMAEGRVGVVARLAAHEARQGYVLRAEKRAVEAQLAEERRQRLAGAQALEEFRKRAAADEKLDAERAARQDQEIADYEKKLEAAGRARRLDESDIDFILRD
jgi:hypothetical protein